MSDMKCPFCGKHIRYLGTDLFTCDACHIMLPAKHWIAYINTRKALNVAVDALDTVRQYYRRTAVVRPHNIAAYCDNKIDKIKEITALEQKDK